MTDASYQNKRYSSREEVPKRKEKPQDVWKGTQNNKKKKVEKSPFEFNCPHLQTSKWSQEPAKVSFLLHELLDVLITITKVVIHHR